MGQAQINVRTRACSGTFIARTKQAALTHNVRGKRLTDNQSLVLLIVVIHSAETLLQLAVLLRVVNLKLLLHAGLLNW